MLAEAASAGDFPAVKARKIDARVHAKTSPHDPPARENSGDTNKAWREVEEANF